MNKERADCNRLFFVETTLPWCEEGVLLANVQVARFNIINRAISKSARSGMRRKEISVNIEWYVMSVWVHFSLVLISSFVLD